MARVYPLINKLFQRSVASLSQSRTSNGLLLLVLRPPQVLFIYFNLFLLYLALICLKFFVSLCNIYLLWLLEVESYCASADSVMYARCVIGNDFGSSKNALASSNVLLCLFVASCSNRKLLFGIKMYFYYFSFFWFRGSLTCSSGEVIDRWWSFKKSF